MEPSEREHTTFALLYGSRNRRHTQAKAYNIIVLVFHKSEEIQIQYAEVKTYVAIHDFLWEYGEIV